ncbi:MAG: hypothetical protein ACLTZM_00110 [Ruminococcus sp.]
MCVTICERFYPDEAP